MLFPSPSRNAFLAAALLVLTCTCGTAQDQQPQPATDGPAPLLVLSVSTFGGSPQYQSWPLVLELTLWREPRAEATMTAAPPLAITAQQGAWCEALVVTIRDAAGAAVQWPLHLVKQDGAQLSLAADGGAAAEWWLTPEETQALPEGEYTLSVAFDPQRVDGLPEGADAPRTDECRLVVAAEPAPLDAAAAADKLYQQAWYCIVREDKAGADASLAALMAADPQSIGARRLEAMLAAREGNVEEGLRLIDEALVIYQAKHPKACPPYSLMALRNQLRAQLPAAAEAQGDG